MLKALREPAEEALRILTRAGCDFADVFLEQVRVFRVKLEDQRIAQSVDGGETGAGLRLVKDGQTFFACTNDLTPAGLVRAAGQLVREEIAPADTRTAAPLAESDSFIQELPAAERVRLAWTAERAARAAGPDIRQVTVMLSGTDQHIAVARSDGSWCVDARRQTMLWVQAVAQRADLVQTGFESAGASRAWDLFTEQDPAGVGRLAGERAQRMLTARPAPSGRFTAVLAAEAGGTMIHEAIGHALEADLVQKDLSIFKDQVGRRVASVKVSVADDPTMPFWRGSYRVDDEGTLARRTLLVRDGVLLGFLHDHLSALQAGVAPTGNGRRQSYAHRPIPRMSNTMILPGDQDPSAILRSVAQGLLVKRMGGGQVNTVTGDFMFEVSEGYWIRNGEVAEPVRGAALIGNASEVLQSIDMVGTDLGQGIGTCGKEDQGVPVSDAQPTLRIPEITIGGIS